MKKLKLTLIGFLAISSLNAQVSKQFNPLIKKGKEQFTEIKGVKPTANVKTILWSNDFSNAADWNIVDSVGTDDSWVIGTGIPTGSFAIAGITSTTASNGFALFDSDLLCSGTQNSDLRIVAPIDLTGNANVKVEFESFYRKFQGRCYVIASTDGVNWTYFPVHTSLAVNGATTNPQITQVNVSSVIGNSATAYIGFKYVGGCDYAWMVDDVKISTVDDYDLEMTDAYWGSTGFWGARLPYYQVPISQLAPIEFGGIVSNIGAIDQSDVVFTAALQGGAFSSSSVASTILHGTFDTLDVTDILTPPATVANHIVNLSVTSGATDAAPANNAITAAATISVNNYIYARDKGTIVGGSFNQGEGFEVGNIFDIYEAVNLKGIDVVVSASAEAGAEMFVKLYSIDSNTGDFVFVDESLPHNLTTSELGQKITLTLINGASSLNADESYLVVAGSFGDGGLTDDLVVGTSGISERSTSFYLDYTDNTWYYTTATPMVRMNFDPILSIDEMSDASNFTVSPNPANEVINVKLNNADNAVITISDLAGKVVSTTTTNGVSTSVSTAGLNSGVYLVNVTIGNTTSTQKVVIKK
jgi:hypothetical protein